jgi:hypothetical protein
MPSKTIREAIQSYIWSSFIADYGIITQVNSDETIDVKHAVKLVLSTEDSMSDTITKSIEVLWPSSAAFSFRHTLAVGDRVLLIGLKFNVPTVDIDTTDFPDTLYHYSQETLKAMPLCLYDANAGTTIEETNGNLRINSGHIELNGNTRTFVTHAELDTALQTFITALNLHVHPTAAPGPPSVPFVAMSLNIATAETTTIFTGG